MESSSSSSSNQQIPRPRRPILHTCGVSLLNIARIIHSKASDTENPTGLITTKLTKFASITRPFMYFLPLIQWLLLILLLVDKQILAIENILEIHFPALSRLFNEVDELVIVVENLPGKFVLAMSSLIRMIIRRVPFLGWSLIQVVSWLNFINYVLNYLELDNAREKDIMIDVNCNGGLEPASYGTKITEKPDMESGAITKEEIWDKGTKDDTEGHNLKNLKLKAEEGKEEDEEETERKEGNGEDQILDLFEFAWHMKPGKGGNGSPMARQIM